jgi:hypothetical protein
MLPTLLRRQTANKHHQGSRIIFSEFLSKCWHFTFNSLQNRGLNPFVGLCDFVEIWPFVSGCVNAVAMRTVKRKQLCSCCYLRVFYRAVLRGRLTRGRGSVGLNNARRPDETTDDRPGDQQGGDQSLYFNVHYEDKD